MIESIKDLEKLLKVCRKQGVKEIKLGEISISLGELPSERSSQMEDLEKVDSLAGFPNGMLTPEQLMFYSSGGTPADDPTLQAEAG